MQEHKWNDMWYTQRSYCFLFKKLHSLLWSPSHGIYYDQFSKRATIDGELPLDWKQSLRAHAYWAVIKVC